MASSSPSSQKNHAEQGRAILDFAESMDPPPESPTRELLTALVHSQFAIAEEIRELRAEPLARFRTRDVYLQPNPEAAGAATKALTNYLLSEGIAGVDREIPLVNTSEWREVVEAIAPDLVEVVIAAVFDPPEISLCTGNCLRRMEPGSMGKPPVPRTWREDLRRSTDAAIDRRNEARAYKARLDEVKAKWADTRDRLDAESEAAERAEAALEEAAKEFERRAKLDEREGTGPDTSDEERAVISGIRQANLEAAQYLREKQALEAA